VVAPAFVDPLIVPTSASVGPPDPRTALDDHDWHAVRAPPLAGEKNSPARVALHLLVTLSKNTHHIE
jgi:hypothetical protein